MTVYLIHARTEPHVLILLEVIAVIAKLDTLEATVKQVNNYITYIKLWKVGSKEVDGTRVHSSLAMVCLRFFLTERENN